jgi:hypothetical protein
MEGVLVCDEIKDDESIYSIIETNKIESELLEDEIDLIDELAGVKMKMMDQVESEHDWIRGQGNYSIKWAYCACYPSQDNRFTCSLCLRKACASA